MTRRYAELAAALQTLRLSNEKPDALVIGNLSALQNTMIEVLHAFARALGPDQRRIFLINNIDLILTVFYERSLKPDCTQAFEDLLRCEVASFIESQFANYYLEMVIIIRKKHNVFRIINIAFNQNTTVKYSSYIRTTLKQVLHHIVLHHCKIRTDHLRSTR